METRCHKCYQWNIETDEWKRTQRSIEETDCPVAVALHSTSKGCDSKHNPFWLQQVLYTENDRLCEQLLQLLEGPAEPCYTTILLHPHRPANLNIRPVACGPPGGLIHWHGICSWWHTGLFWSPQAILIPEFAVLSPRNLETLLFITWTCIFEGSSDIYIYIYYNSCLFDRFV